MKLCFLPSPGAPHASRHKRKHQTKKKHNNYFLSFSGSKQLLPGAFCYQNLCWKTKLNIEFQLKVQNLNLKTDPSIGVWNSLFFQRKIWKIYFLHKRSHEDSWSPWSQPKRDNKNNFTDKISQKMQEKLNFRRKATQNSPRLCKGKAKEYSCSCRSGKKKLYF